MLCNYLIVWCVQTSLFPAKFLHDSVWNWHLGLYPTLNTRGSPPWPRRQWISLRTLGLNIFWVKAKHFDQPLCICTTWAQTPALTQVGRCLRHPYWKLSSKCKSWRSLRRFPLPDPVEICGLKLRVGLKDPTVLSQLLWHPVLQSSPAEFRKDICE